MPTIKNQLPTLTPNAVQKFQTVNKIADQLDSVSLLLDVVLITATPTTPKVNTAYLVAFGANIGKLLYYYLDSATASLFPVSIPCLTGDSFGPYIRNATTWVLNQITVPAAGVINSSALVEGLNRINAQGAITFAFTGTVYSNIAAANPLPLPAGLTLIYKDGGSYYVSR